MTEGPKDQGTEGPVMPEPPRPQDDKDKKRDDLEKEYRELRDKIQVDATGPLLARLGDVCIEQHRTQEAVSYYNRALQADIAGAQYLITRIENKLTPDEFNKLVISAPIVPIADAIGDILFYPFRGRGLGMMIIGSIFFAIFRFIVSIIGSGFIIFQFIAIGLIVVMTGYLLTYYISILKRTAFHGDNEPPTWPDLAHIMGEIVVPFFQMLITLFMVFLPSLIGLYVGYKMGLEVVGLTIVFFGLSIFGIFVWPMLLIIVYIFNHIGAAIDPRFVLGSIARMGFTYIIGAVIFYLMMLAFGVILVIEGFIFNIELGIFLMIPLGPFFWFARLYVFMAAFRLLGLMYREKAQALKWFT